MKKQTLMSKAEYARYKGWSRANVTNHVKAGNITTTPDGKIDPERADLELEANSPRTSNRTKGEAAPHTSQVSLSRIRAVREIYQVKKAKFEVEQLEGTLVDLKSMQDAAFRQGRLVRDTLLAIPSRLAPVVANESDVHRVHEIIHKEVMESLRAIDKAEG